MAANATSSTVLPDAPCDSSLSSGMHAPRHLHLGAIQLVRHSVFPLFLSSDDIHNHAAMTRVSSYILPTTFKFILNLSSEEAR